MKYTLWRSFLFMLPPEVAHKVSLFGLKQLSRLKGRRSLVPSPHPLAKTVMGLEFPNPIGLAAGLDKNAEYLDGLAGLGFGFIEVGTVTPKPQRGNPKPRLFRLVPEEALINRMGFNNKGVDYLVEQVKRSRYRGILGINIGKNATTPLEQAIDDYVIAMEKVYPYASYIVVNLSSPNTPGLRDLQHGALLRELLGTLKTLQGKLTSQYYRYVPLVIKVAPDLRDEQIIEIAHALLEFKLDGLIATNTTFSRDNVDDSPYKAEVGGLSGRPLMASSTQVQARFYELLQGKIPIIGVGGIMDAADAKQKLATGAELVQLYTGLIYRGPAWVKSLLKAL